MGKETFILVPEEEISNLNIQQRLSSGELTLEVFETLSPEEQAQVKGVLFNKYSEPVPTPAALSALEFTIFGLAKLFFKVGDGGELTETEQAFYDRFREYVDQHEITLNPNDWYVPYAESGMLTAKENRAEYKTKKEEITGSF